jgi:hypothetical protein
VPKKKTKKLKLEIASGLGGTGPATDWPGMADWFRDKMEKTLHDIEVFLRSRWSERTRSIRPAIRKTPPSCKTFKIGARIRALAV